MNAPAVIEDVTKHGETQYYWQMYCGNHVTLKTSQAVHRNLAALECERCTANSSGRFSDGASEYEKDAWKAMQLVEHEWLVEIRILKGRYSSADIWIPFTGRTNSQQQRTPVRLIIMVDGETHFERDHEGRVTLEEQQAIDKRFNDQCWMRNLRLLRLHYDDTRAYSQLIQNALQKCLSAPNTRFRMFSASFPGMQYVEGPFSIPPEKHASCNKRKGC